MLRKNEIIELEIHAVTHEGAGVGRHSDGMAVFVPMTAPGDRIRARVVKVLRRHAFAIVEELIAPSGLREENRCPAYRQCGGCSLRHLSYPAELEIKAGWVEENLRRIGGVRVEMDPILPSPSPARYRNKAQYPFGRDCDGRIVTGFYARRSHRLVAVADCLLQPEIFGTISRLVCGFLEERRLPIYDEESHTGLARHLYLRMGEATGQVMVCLVINGKKLPGWEELADRLAGAVPGLASLVLNHNTMPTNVILGERSTVLWGEDGILDIIAGITVRLSPHSFYQVNREAAQNLYHRALEYASPTPEGLLLDLYCGAGAIGLSMAPRAGRVLGVEVVEQAVEDARENALRNGVANAEFLRADAAEAAQRLREEGLRPQVVVLDPPRKGVAGEVIACVAGMEPERVVYISCNSATLARDLKEFGELGYAVRRAGAADLFPRTAHVEAVALLEKGRK